MNAPPRLAYVALVAVCVIWGTTYLGIRVALEAVPPALMGALRWLTAGSLLLAYAWLRGQALPHVGSWASLAVQGLLMIGFGNGLVNWAEQSVPPGRWSTQGPRTAGVRTPSPHTRGATPRQPTAPPLRGARRPRHTP